MHLSVRALNLDRHRSGHPLRIDRFAAAHRHGGTRHDVDAPQPGVRTRTVAGEKHTGAVDIVDAHVAVSGERDHVDAAVGSIIGIDHHDLVAPVRPDGDDAAVVERLIPAVAEDPESIARVGVRG
ncbi:hypothetical protein [Microbacterium oxydans]|uniref:hypothetical protein n=1 Tax=Microbacterium oxydans TaxID=82380 RepID=UPI0024AC85D1|nr:hypothetical protein [Microbacterium oxydans]